MRDLTMLKKETSRYKMNKFLSDNPISKICFQADVTKNDLPEIHEHLKLLSESNSLTLIVVENHTPKSYL